MTHIFPSKNAHRSGFTLIELITSMAAALIIFLVAAMLLASGHRSWARTYGYANSQARLDALETMITLGTMGRQSNKVNYRLYQVENNRFVPAIPSSNPEELVTGEAVEFRYWGTELDADIVDTSITATAYALFYLADDELRLDLGPYPPGGVDDTGRRFQTSYVTTLTLARNVTSVGFSHLTRNLQGDGRGCIRMNLQLADPADNSTLTVMTATLMRNVWP